jgi:hypothetical protein
MTIKYYKSKDYQKFGAAAYFLVNLEDFRPATRGDRNDLYMSYAPIGQHSECAREYFENDCLEITKKEYIPATKGLYTPKDYLN